MDPLLVVIMSFGLMFLVTATLSEGLAQVPHQVKTRGSLARIEATCYPARSQCSDPTLRSRRQV